MMKLVESGIEVTALHNHLLRAEPATMYMHEGVLEAAFDGNHGWFWRNRTDADVIVTLKTNGAYTDIKRMM